MDTSKNSQHESSILKVSVLTNLLLAIIALYYGFKTGSEAIRLDGYYSFAGFLLALISLWVVNKVMKPETANFNFGYSIIEPLFNLVKGLMILAVVASSFVNAINSLLHGGNTPDFGESITYFLISTISCLVLTILFYRKNKTVPSPIIHVEYKNWFIDTVISASIGVAFVTSYLLQHTNFDSWIKYTDPVVTILIVAMVIKLPVTTIYTGLKEILLSAPGKDIVDKIDDIISEVLSEYDYKNYNFKVTKTGREIYLLIHVQVVNQNTPLYLIKTQDEVRQKTGNALNKLFNHIKIDMVFSENDISYDF